MDERVWLALGIILVTGLVGGLAAALTAERSKEADQRAYARYLLLGVIAAACVPLFLSLVRSQVTQEMFGHTADPATGRRYPLYYESYLVFIGICLLAAFSARKFIDSISRQVLQKLERVEEKADDAVAVAADARQAAHEVVTEVEEADQRSDTPLPPEAAEEDDDPAAASAAARPLSAQERRALEALTVKTYRTRSGIAEDSGISRTRISEVLDDLHRKKLAMPTKSPTTGGVRWLITKRGETVLKPR